MANSLERRTNFNINAGGLTEGQAIEVRKLIDAMIVYCPSLHFSMTQGLMEPQEDLEDYSRGVQVRELTRDEVEDLLRGE